MIPCFFSNLAISSMAVVPTNSNTFVIPLGNSFITFFVKVPSSNITKSAPASFKNRNLSFFLVVPITVQPIDFANCIVASPNALVPP